MSELLNNVLNELLHGEDSWRNAALELANLVIEQEAKIHYLEFVKKGLTSEIERLNVASAIADQALAGQIHAITQQKKGLLSIQKPLRDYLIMGLSGQYLNFFKAEITKLCKYPKARGRKPKNNDRQFYEDVMRFRTTAKSDIEALKDYWLSLPENQKKRESRFDEEKGALKTRFSRVRIRYKIPS